MEEMTDPIKIHMTGDSRSKLSSRGVVPSMEDGVENAKAAFDALSRQKTNIVIKNESEAAGVLRGVEKMRARSPSTCTWMVGAHKRAFSRVYGELISALREREWCGYEPKPETNSANCPTDGCSTAVAATVGDVVPCANCGTEIEIPAP